MIAWSGKDSFDKQIQLDAPLDSPNFGIGPEAKD
jgi:hypothetical protein